MEIEETKILEKLSETDQPQPIIDELTGVFLIGRAKTGEIAFQLDASGMQYGCYDVMDGGLVLASHPQLPGDLFDLKRDPYVDRLVSYRWYQYMLG